MAIGEKCRRDKFPPHRIISVVEHPCDLPLILILLLNVPDLARSSVRSAPGSFDSSPSFFFNALPYFLALQDASGSPYIYPTPVLESVISPRSPVSFKWKMVFRNQELGAQCAPGLLALLAPPRVQSRNQPIYTHIPVPLCAP